jgi:hypothetical protein
VKKIFLFIYVLFFINNCFGQDTVELRNRLSDSVIERFYVLKSDKQIKEGLYRAFFKRKKIIASGNYHINKKTGIWNFFKPNGRFVQRFNYDSNTLLYESVFDTLADVSYRIDKKLKLNDTVTRPVKAGGIYYGFIPYLNAFKLPFDATDINTDYFDATVELLISPLGRLADYKVHLYSAYYQYNQTFNLDVSLFSEADRSFIPLTINHQPTISRITINCYVTPRGGLDFN